MLDRENIRRTSGSSGRVLGGWAATLLLAGLLTGCNSLFEVDNPNNIKGEDTALPEAANSVVNGAYGTVAKGLAASLGVYSPITDEITYIGSRDAWGDLNTGIVSNPQNEFLNVAFPFIAQGRWMADEAIKLMEQHQADGNLRDPLLLARAYLYGALAYINIADTWDNFALSDRNEAAAPVGEDSMGSLYDTAIQYLTQGMSIAQAQGEDDMVVTMTAVRARAYHAHAIWDMLNPPGTTPASPLVSSTSAVQDARAVLAMNGGDEQWRYTITLANNDMVPGGEITLGHNMNDRAELQFGADLVDTAPDDVASITGIALMDPVDGIPDPVVTEKIAEFQDAFLYTVMTIVSAREMHLIIAEAALASGNTAEAVTEMNTVRGLDGLSDYDPATSGLTPMEMLVHERRVNLLLENRRLADMYRFGIDSRYWTSTSDAMTTPGSFLTIPQVELLSNCHILGSC